MRWLIGLALLVLGLPWTAVARSTHGLPDLATEQQAWWGDMARGYVAEGCLAPVPSPGGLTITLPPCRAYGLERTTRQLAYIWEEMPRTLTLPSTPGTYWVAAHRSVSTAVPGWTRVPGTHYLWQVNTVLPTPPDGGVLLSAWKVESSVITTRGDARPDSPIPGAPANLRSALFGAAGDCVADDTAALQAWVNNVAWRNTEGYAPTGCYKFSRLFLTYDAANNPGFPPDNIDRGGFVLRGTGPAQMNHLMAPEASWPGTTLLSTATTAPAVSAVVPVGAGSGNLGRGIRLENLSVVQSSSSPVLQFDGIHSRSGLRDLFIVQRGSGNGLEWSNSFLTWIEDTFVVAQNQATNTGVGVHVKNTETPGGVLRLVNVTARSFGTTCVRAGAQAPQATRLQTVQMQGVQGGSCPIGLQVWGGVRSLSCDGCYFEGFRDYGVFIRENAQGVSIVNSWFAAGGMNEGTDAAIRVGGGSASLNDAAVAVTVHNNTLVDVLMGYGIWRDVGASVRGASIKLNDIALGPSANAGIYCGALGLTQQNELEIFGNTFQGSGTNLVDASCRTGEFIYDQNALWLGRLVNFGQGVPLASAPTITLDGGGNLYNLTGTDTVTTITCSFCRPGAVVWFYVPAGNTPQMSEAGNLHLAGSSWAGTSNDMIGLMWTTAGKWVEMHRSEN